MRLQQYFSPESVTAALDAYATATSPARLNWPIEGKLKLYALALDAFASELDEPSRLRAFHEIYEELRRHWGVFRGTGPNRRWDSPTLYRKLLSTCQPLARSSGLTLLSLDPQADRARVLQALRAVRSMKQTAQYPWMPASKFLHQFTPGLKPIYDGAVVWESVLWGRPARNGQPPRLGAFRGDYIQFCTSRRLRPREDSEVFNWNYLLLASDVMSRADTPALMRIFADWVRRRAGSGADSAVLRVLDELETYYATAFEFIAIGGAELELQARGLGGV